MITIRYFSQMQALTGVASEQTEAATVADALRHVKSAYGAKALQEAKSSLIVVNDTSIALLDGKKTRLTDNDVLAFLPLCGGG